MIVLSQIIEQIKAKDLKVTPQRVAILEAIMELNNHPTVENIVNFLKTNHPNIATGTVYNVLQTLVEVGLIRRVQTEKDNMRYEMLGEQHHHLYCHESDRIEDYYNSEISGIITTYFEKHRIEGFEIEDIRLHIKGKFKPVQKSTDA